MQSAGYVLAGGASSRMGSNKAFLLLAGRTMLEIATGAVLEAVGNVTIVGSPDLYGHLEYAVIADSRAGAGPLAGIETALRHSTADWNLIVACDMPRLTAVMLRRIVGAAVDSPGAGCILPESGEGRAEPLCAVYHKCMLPVISSALDAGIRKVTDALPREQVHYIRIPNDPVFQNINTPEEWSELSRMVEP